MIRQWANIAKEQVSNHISLAQLRGYYGHGMIYNSWKKVMFIIYIYDIYIYIYIDMLISVVASHGDVYIMIVSKPIVKGYNW